MGGEKHKAWVDFKQGKVRVASREEDASAKLQALKGRADEAKNEKAQGLVAKAEDVLKASHDSLASLQSSARQTEQKGQKGTKKKGAEAKAVRDEAKKVESGVSALAMLFREIEEALGGSAGGTCKVGGNRAARKAGCWREGTRSSRGNGWSCAMEEWRTGRLVRTRAEAEREEEAAPRLVIEPSEWREVSLVQVDEANGGILTMKLLRPLSWLESEAVAVGAWVSVDLPELGVQGAALVTAVDPCPEIEEGEGRLVTGTFRRSQALVWEVKVEGASEVLGVTSNHLVWSEDRQDWVAVADLRIGERLHGWDGSTPAVESLTTCTEPEPVYNIEVEGDHCYRVGEQGLLVHNNSVESQAGKPEDKPCCDLGEAKQSGASQDFFGTKLLSPSVLNEKQAQIPLSPKSKAIASDTDGHVYIVGAEIPPKHIGASKHTEVFGEGVVIKITQQLLDRILNIIKTQSPMYEIKAGNSVLRSAQANASHAEVQAIVSYLDRHPDQRGKTIKSH